MKNKNKNKNKKVTKKDKKDKNFTSLIQDLSNYIQKNKADYKNNQDDILFDCMKDIEKLDNDKEIPNFIKNYLIKMFKNER